MIYIYLDFYKFLYSSTQIRAFLQSKNLPLFCFIVENIGKKQVKYKKQL